MNALAIVIFSLLVVFLLYLYVGGYEKLATSITENDIADFMDLLKDIV